MPKGCPRRWVVATSLTSVLVLATGCTAAESTDPAPVSSTVPTTVSRAADEGAEGAGDAYYPTDGNGGYEVDNYDLEISYDPATRRLDGFAKITANPQQPLRRFNLDLYGLDVRSVQVDTRQATFERLGEKELVITPAAPVQPGRPFLVEVRYDGVPKLMTSGSLGDNGWHSSDSGPAFAAGEPQSASTWYPVNETPRDKARFKLAIRVPDGWGAVSNGLEEGTTQADGWTTYRWSEQTPLASYLTTVAIDRWTIVRSQLPDGTPVLDAYAPGSDDMKKIEARLPEVIEFLSSKFGKYPQRAAGGIFINASIGFSLETQTRPTYAQWADLETVVHENAHQWFGNSVSVDSWADICLNECFASYAQWLWAEAKEGKILDDAYRKAIDDTKDTGQFWANKLYDMGRGSEFRGVYDKGILAMHALRKQIGEEAFGRVLKEWPAAHRDSNASWPEFEQFVAGIAGQDLRGFFDAWFRGDKIPGDPYLFPGSLRK
jgi:aminopeptidase N